MSSIDDLIPLLKKLRLSGVLQSLDLRTRQAVEDSLSTPSSSTGSAPTRSNGVTPNTSTCAFVVRTSWARSASRTSIGPLTRKCPKPTH